jgi:DNA-binding MarR family transcriptional regulator
MLTCEGRTMASKDDAQEGLLQQVGAELAELRQAADRLDEAVAALYGLNRTDLRCLGILYRRGRVTAGELAEETGLTPGAITTALDRMEKGGFANRVADPEDRRRVLVLSTVAAREVGGRIYGEVEVASQRLLEGRDADELTAIRDYLRGAREVYEGQVSHIVALSTPGEGGETVATGAESSAPVGQGGSARLEFNRGAARIVVHGDPSLPELYRARFEGPPPEVLVRGNTVTVQAKRRFRPFEWRSQSSDILLNAGVSWALSFRGGMWKMSGDLRGLRLESIELVGGASEVEFWLPAADRTVPVRLSGGASRITLHRPEGVPVRAQVVGGASQLVFDEQRMGSIAGRSHFSSPGFDEAEGRYDIRFSGGASQIVIDTD